jgi:hypothetical protein
MSYQKLSSLIRFHFNNLNCFLSLSGPVLFFQVRGHIEERHEKLAIKPDIAYNQCCTSRLNSWVRQKLDGEVTEVLQQEWSCNHAEGAASQPYTLPTYTLSTYTINGAEDPMVIIHTFKIRLN